MKLTFGIITLNAEFFINEVLESIYPFAHKIIIADGPVKWWYDQGVYASTDGTIKRIAQFPDPENKILLVLSDTGLDTQLNRRIVVNKGVPFYAEKDQQCQAWFKYVPADTDYVICNDADEVHSPENLEKLIRFLEKEDPTSVGFKSDSFFGGFDRIIGGFERDHSFKRVLKYLPGSFYRTHRQPTLAIGNNDITGKDITGNQLFEQTGITMWHGSYVSPLGVYNKIRYYESAVISPGKCIPNYFSELWLPWVMNADMRPKIEKRWKGVQEFTPESRGECYTEAFTGVHPPSIKNNIGALHSKLALELHEIMRKVKIEN